MLFYICNGSYYFRGLTFASLVKVDNPKETVRVVQTLTCQN